MATNKKTRKRAGKRETEAQEALSRLKILVKETETLADEFEKVAREKGLAV